ncbi:putative prophage CPS-53 integrase [Marinobacterium sp. xm-d-420]|jgi:integrase|uniref:tyrosine-type recombinase/integrase n=1 Tax=Marinobacterium sp. xm-d-420 TaxID=2497737 RepID=UPI0015684CD5|nr:tyrosine-type recombinase/integrase [Marinobacterium sp. xm-d-420]NRP27482.1 putative prophage CPS-53 integrase [Marinobacterium sp. xm-d-420]
MGYKMIPDTQVHQLFKRPTAKGDKWVVSARVKGGSPTKVTLGYCSNLPAKEARVIAKRHLADMAQGINPNTKLKMDQVKGFTLREAIDQYMAEKLGSGSIKPSTVKSYNSTLNNNLGKWMNRAIASITPQECVTRYHQIKEEVAKRSIQKVKANEPGLAEANKAMRTLSVILGYYANDFLPDNLTRILPNGNPVSVLANKKLKKPLKPRTNSLSFEQRRELLDFLTDPSHYYNPDMTPKQEHSRTPVKREHAHWIIILLCTGLRKEEPLKMRWEDVDFEHKTFTVTDTKNGKPLVLPMTVRTESILLERSEQLSSVSDYVFPQHSNPSKPATMNRVCERIAKLSGIDFTAHDLRRTTATALSELGYSIEDIGRILNHSRKSVTDQYIQTSLEHLRGALEELEQMLFDWGTDESNSADIDWGSLNEDSVETF